MMSVLDAMSVLIATVTMLIMKLLVGIRQDVTIYGADTSCLDWLGNYLRPFVLNKLEL